MGDEAVNKNNKKQRNILELVWDWFASVKVGISLIVILALGSALGTIYPQVNAIPHPNPNFYYKDTYGTLGDLYHKFGLSNMYTSWWFLTLVLLLGISLVIVSIDRGVPLYKSLKNQPVARKVIALRADRLYTNKEAATAADLTALGQALQKRRYKIRTVDGALLAEKGRLPRFGAYVIHAGLIVIILGVFARLIPGWYYDEMVWLKEDESKTISEVGFTVKNTGFQLEYYEGGDRVKKYETDLEVYEGAQKVAEKHLIVNEPLTYNNTLVFQNSFDPTPMFKNGKVEMIDRKTEQSLGTFDINFIDPQETYTVGPYQLKLTNYFPDIKVDAEKGVYTSSNEPYNPGLSFEISGPNLAPTQQWMMPTAPFVEQMLGQEYPFTLKMVDVSLFNMTGLLVHRDLGIPVVYTGCAITLYGLVLVFYFQHRRIWARLEDGVLHIGANTNKNWLGFAKEFNKAVEPLGATAAVLKSKLAKQPENQPEPPHTTESETGREGTQA